MARRSYVRQEQQERLDIEGKCSEALRFNNSRHRLVENYDRALRYLYLEEELERGRIGRDMSADKIARRLSSRVSSRATSRASSVTRESAKEPPKYTDDNNLVVTFGKHRGRPLGELNANGDFYKAAREEDLDTYKALCRRKSKIGVTTVIKGLLSAKLMPSYIPAIVRCGNVPTIERPRGVDAGLYGTFIEHLVCTALKAPPQIDDLLEMTTVENEYVERARESQEANPRSILDILNVSLMFAIRNKDADPKKFDAITRIVRAKAEEYEEFMEEVSVSFGERARKRDQKTCRDICVGSVCGEIDLIYRGVIVDIKCVAEDVKEYYRMQLFGYASLHYLRYGPQIASCEIWNFITGRRYMMSLDGLTHDIANKFVTLLGSHCKQHVDFMQSYV